MRCHVCSAHHGWEDAPAPWEFVGGGVAGVLLLLVLRAGLDLGTRRHPESGWVVWGFLAHPRSCCWRTAACGEDKTTRGRDLEAGVGVIRASQ